MLCPGFLALSSNDFRYNQGVRVGSTGAISEISMVTDKHVSRIDLKHASKTAATTMTLLVLLADTPVDAVKAKHGDYHDVFSSLFARSAEQMTRDVNDSANASSLELIIKSYDVVNEPWEYPSQEEVRQATGLLITGSGE